MKVIIVIITATITVIRTAARIPSRRIQRSVWWLPAPSKTAFRQTCSVFPSNWKAVRKRQNRRFWLRRLLTKECSKLRVNGMKWRSIQEYCFCFVEFGEILWNKWVCIRKIKFKYPKNFFVSVFVSVSVLFCFCFVLFKFVCCLL